MLSNMRIRLPGGSRGAVHGGAQEELEESAGTSKAPVLRRSGDLSSRTIAFKVLLGMLVLITVAFLWTIGKRNAGELNAATVGHSETKHISDTFNQAGDPLKLQSLRQPNEIGLNAVEEEAVVQQGTNTIAPVTMNEGVIKQEHTGEELLGPFNAADSCFFADGKTKLGSAEVPKSAVTVVTGFFQISSKHSFSTFDEWIGNFMKIDFNVVAFTNTESTAQFLIGKRPEHLRNRLLICLMPLEETLVYKRFGKETLEFQHKIDPEAGLHKGYPLYVIWLSKPEYVLRAASFNPYQSEFFVWNDIGTFRNSAVLDRYMGKWPDGEKTRSFCGKSTVAFVIMDPTLMDRYCDLGPITTVEEFQNNARRRMIGQGSAVFTVAGAEFCGTVTAFKAYHREFVRVLDVMIAAKTFVGMDQTVMFQVAVSKPEVVRIIQEQTSGWRDWFLLSDALRKHGTPGPNPVYTIESCAERRRKTGA